MFLDNQSALLDAAVNTFEGANVGVQGILWVKEREAKNQLKVVRMGASDTATKMERAIEAGHSVLIENMGESIDAVLNPVITRSTFKKVSRSMIQSQSARGYLLSLCIPNPSTKL